MQYGSGSHLLRKMTVNIILIIMLLLFLFDGSSGQVQDIQLISKSRSPNLEKYEGYSDAVLMLFNIPDNTIFASFAFVASEQDLSIFGCTIRDVSLYLKYGGPPLINPDGAPFPEEIKNVSRPTIYNLEFFTDRKESFINISSPEPGTYYAVTFLAYEDPRYRKISQQGLTQSCQAFVDASVHVIKVGNPTIITDNQIIDVIGLANETRYFMFMAPESLDHAILKIENMTFSSNFRQVTISVQARRPPTKDVFIWQKSISDSNSPVQTIFRIEPRTLYYIRFEFRINSNGREVSELNFRLRFFTNRLPSSQTFVSQTYGNTTIYNMSVVHKRYQSYRLTDIQPYKQFTLARESTAENFAFSYKLQPEMETNMFVPINITTHEFSALKFTVRKSSDIGGSLQYILAFKPRITRDGGHISLAREPEHHIIVGCIQKDAVAVPTWPKYCVSNEISILSPIVLNETVANSTVLIPYPESGVWYASFKLFCGTCVPCDCPKSCQQNYQSCTIECKLNCTSAFAEDCENCVENCSSSIISTDECSSCNCDGPCLRNTSSTCNSSVIFDVSSRPCYFGGCGKQGKCGLLISEGTAYSSCLCKNKYRGFDCSDGSLATPYYLVLLEFVLLILSNIWFLPATYVAYKREYYVESLSYFSIFLSSSLYHACDAGENILSFCVFRLGALQFADFFSALLAIWLTLLAMADLCQVQNSILQMAGSIIIAFCVTLNRYAFWIFAMPSCVGLVIIAISWFLKYRKFRSRFIEKRYLYIRLPVGATVVVIGLIIYGLLQTEDNYKYLHSLWHMIMATGVFFLLPKRDTFQAAALLS